MNRRMVMVLMLLGMLPYLAVVSCSSESTDQDKTPVSMQPASSAVSGSGNIEEGAKIFREKCSVCHGAGGIGDIGPDLTDNEWKYGGSENDIYYSISKGRSGGMPNWENILGEEKTRKVIAYIKSISKKQ